MKTERKKNRAWLAPRLCARFSMVEMSARKSCAPQFCGIRKVHLELSLRRKVACHQRKLVLPPVQCSRGRFGPPQAIEVLTLRVWQNAPRNVQSTIVIGEGVPILMTATEAEAAGSRKQSCVTLILPLPNLQGAADARETPRREQLPEVAG